MVNSEFKNTKHTQLVKGDIVKLVERMLHGQRRKVVRPINVGKDGAGIEDEVAH